MSLGKYKIKEVKAFKGNWCKHSLFKSKEDAIDTILEEMQIDFYDLLFDDDGNYRKYKSLKSKVKTIKKFLQNCLNCIDKNDDIEKETTA